MNRDVHVQQQVERPLRCAIVRGLSRTAAAFVGQDQRERQAEEQEQPLPRVGRGKQEDERQQRRKQREQIPHGLAVLHISALEGTQTSSRAILAMSRR